MSNEEQEKMSKIAEDIRAIKRWWPVFAAIFAIGWAIVKISSSATSLYDNDLAKKTDIQTLTKQVSGLSREISILNTSFQHYRVSDSIDRASSAARIADAERAINSLKNRYTTLVVEVKKHGITTFVPVKN